MLFHQTNKAFLFTIIISTALAITGCGKGNDNNNITDPDPFPQYTEDSTGSHARSITYVYDRTALDMNYPPRKDSSVIFFSYDGTGKLDRMRWMHNNLVVYDFYFTRTANKLTAIRSRTWTIPPDTGTHQLDFKLEYNPSGVVTLMTESAPNDPLHEVDSFIVKSTGSRIDTVIDRNSFNHDKYAYTYNGSGDITGLDHIVISGIFYSYMAIGKYTFSGTPAPLVLGDEAILLNYFIQFTNISGATDRMIPATLFQSSKLPSKLLWQAIGLYTGTSNYQTTLYPSGRPKKMTADITTPAGDFYAREAYYYSYMQ